MESNPQRAHGIFSDCRVNFIRYDNDVRDGKARKIVEFLEETENSEYCWAYFHDGYLFLSVENYETPEKAKEAANRRNEVFPEVEYFAVRVTKTRRVERL